MAQLGASPSGRGAGVRAASDSSLAASSSSIDNAAVFGILGLRARFGLGRWASWGMDLLRECPAVAGDELLSGPASRSMAALPIPVSGRGPNKGGRF